MLNIFKLKVKKENKEFNIKQELDNYLWKNKYYPAYNREWFNSIYFFNKNNHNIILPSIDIIINKIIKYYFNMYNPFLEKRIKLPFLKKWKRRYISNRFWISKGAVKHNNDKIIITLYIYNRQYNYLINKLNSLEQKLVLNYNNNKNNIQLKLKKSWINVIINNTWSKLPVYNYTYKKNINRYNSVISFFSRKNLEIINLILKRKISNYKFNTEMYIRKILKRYIKKCLNREIFYLKYKQTILFNKLKFSDNLLLPLRRLLTKIYNKKVEFNIINLKHYYLNSDIVSQIITTKLRNRKNRILKVLKSCLRNIKITNLKDLNIVRERNMIIGIYNETINKFLITNTNINIDTIDKFLNIGYINYSKSEKQDIIISNIKHKILSGVRVQGSGRLTKRITAARSIYKLKYIGRLKNLDSSYKGLSTVMLRGNNKSNVQYTLLNNRTRIGAFGLKGWIAGY